MSEAPFWSRTEADLLSELGSRPDGLTTAAATERAATNPVRALRPTRRGALRILAAQFLNPLVGMLVAAAILSVPVGALDDAAVILVIIGISAGLGFAQEYAAEDTVARLLAMVRTTARVRRDGAIAAIDAAEVVPGDVVILSAGTTVPGDARLLMADALQVDEAPLTGESFPAIKSVDPAPADAPPARRSCAVFLGTHVVSGTGEAVVVAVGRDTVLGGISGRLGEPRRPTEFDLGLQHFGALLARVSGVMVLTIFALNVALDRPAAEAFLFAVALAVGLVPELLPAIVSVNLARGARRMAAKDVVVKRLVGIEDLGAVDVLCSDKTGTLTEGRVRLAGAWASDGAPSPRPRLYAYLNARFEAGYASPIDAALRDAGPEDPPAPADTTWTRVGEVPYDFARKRLSVVVRPADGSPPLLITKGQLPSVLERCDRAERADGSIGPLAEVRAAIEVLHARLAADGLRVLGVATRPLAEGVHLDPSVERDLVFIGVIAFSDPPRADAPDTLAALAGLGVRLCVLTGDDRRVAAHLWRTLHGRDPTLLTGADVAALSGDALRARVGTVEVYAEADPNQKERIVTALRRAGHVVAYIGDGINDAPALRASDVGISVDGAADVAREAADVVLRRRDLGAVADGVREGRRTLVTTLTYVHYTTSANFGNMLSMALASAFLPFLPLLPSQILLNNLLSDVPALAIAGDRVDPERVAWRERWDMRRIRRFMLAFGGLSSLFDIATFVLLMTLAGGAAPTFRTGWFVESLLTEVLVLFVMRTRRPAWRSRPATAVIVASVAVIFIAFTLPWTPIGPLFSLVPISAGLLFALFGVALAYVVATEALKARFFRAARA